MVVCGDAGDGLGDSLYEAVIYVRGKVRSLGADARIEPMKDQDHEAVRALLAAAGIAPLANPISNVLLSARTLYHWNADANQTY